MFKKWNKIKQTLHREIQSLLVRHMVSGEHQNATELSVIVVAALLFTGPGL